jgi:hypothetical protein
LASERIEPETLKEESPKPIPPDEPKWANCKQQLKCESNEVKAAMILPS